MGRRGRRRRLRAAPPAPAARPVPAHRSARPRPAGRVRRGVRPERRRALRRVRARVAHDARVRARAHRVVHGRDAERGDGHGRARVRRHPQRARGVRAAHGARVRSPTRTQCPRPHAVRPVTARGRGRGRGVALRPASRSARCATRRSSVRTCRARSAGCCGFRSCPSARSPTRRSRSCIPTTRPAPWWPRSSTASTARATSSVRGAATPWQAVAPRRARAVARARRCSGDRVSASTEVAGAALAPHVIDLLRRGCTGDGSRAIDELGLDRLTPTQDVLRELFDWADVVAIARAGEQAA